MFVTAPVPTDVFGAAAGATADGGPHAPRLRSIGLRTITHEVLCTRSEHDQCASSSLFLLFLDANAL